jgi:predicted nucleotidyltransferase component of viral defense system
MEPKLINRVNLVNKMRRLKFKDPIIFEKTTYALILLSEFVKFYPDLIFKGGTALLLYKFPPVRFSIDIDVILKNSDKNSVPKSLNKLVADSQFFKKVEPDIRKSDIPKEHYKFYYNSRFTDREEYVLSDIIFCSNPYYRLTEKKLNEVPLLSVDDVVKVKIPTSEGLFGDKITAVSPKTIGIPLNEEREMEFVKQVIDLGLLFELINDLEDIIRTFESNSKMENKFRKSHYSQNEILDSVLEVSLRYSQYLLKGSDSSFPEIKCLNRGLRKVSNHLVGRYSQNDLKLSFSKIAYVCNVLKKRNKTDIIKDVDFKMVEGKKLKDNYEILKSLKKTNPGAYFYWILACGE